MSQGATLDPSRQAAILLALQEETLEAKPLEELTAAEIHVYCGFTTTQERLELGDQSQPNGEEGNGIEQVEGLEDEFDEDYEESVLEGIDLDSDGDLSDEEDHSDAAI